jgi:2-keto-4-pentenoate hydratase/2-oxohepta-3-ene-1,7-dioic acid hydratase in catechol pathway
MLTTAPVVAQNERTFRIGKLFQPRNIICVGLNYRDHALECNRPIPKQPILFAKSNGSVVGTGDSIVLPPDTAEVDYEAELAVVIGRRCRNITEDEALNFVAGFTCVNDVSARDFQRMDGQWVRAKSQDTFCPMGPCLVTPDDIPGPQALDIRCALNGTVVQKSNTREMIFGVRELLAYISRGITLSPGDVICTGTPSGVGQAQKPQRFLCPGDEVSVEIEGIGRLTNRVKAEASV